MRTVVRDYLLLGGVAAAVVALGFVAQPAARGRPVGPMTVTYECRWNEPEGYHSAGYREVMVFRDRSGAELGTSAATSPETCRPD